jgi:hypothetical protein
MCKYVYEREKERDSEGIHLKKETLFQILLCIVIISSIIEIIQFSSLFNNNSNQKKAKLLKV